MNYLIREVPKELWDALKHRAIDESLSLKDLIIKIFREYLEEEGKC